ncbi:hypothetical protein MesoLjLc_50270 [Mesorhizobium sp. L-8-10]|uniref:hypothetical protein n=1 Tax=Mesorhizobium sp. L-8-10 TaxID=2744523 RepID=UPI001937D6B0|nr:hypothetical protein [Mesorhizobium sp. L-8-10]BCH33097.1 hypothetical protein MesoLjLc_50270 [Mesorhizobium sp. L-8-10]
MRKDATCLLAAAMLATSPHVVYAECQCLANGRTYDHGEIACLTLPNGSQLARCDKVLNNSSWKKIRDGCPTAGAQPLSPVTSRPAPAVTNSEPRPTRLVGSVPGKARI